MGKRRKIIIAAGSLVVACAVTLAIGIPAAFNNSAKGLDNCQNSKITRLVKAYDGNGKKINPKDVDTNSYEGFLFRLNSDAPATLHSKQALKEFKGQITYYPSSGLYAADSLDSIDNFVNEKYIDEIEPNYYVTVADVNSSDYSTKANTPTPNDPKYSKQWNLTMMNVQGAWQNNLYGQNIDKLTNDNVTVAIVDSGIIGSGAGQAKHEDIDYSHVLKGTNLVDSNGGTPDTLGHGTFIAGLIAANMNNGLGIAGITPDVDLLPIRIFGSSGRASTSTVIEGIYDAIDADVDVINLSLGSSGYSAEMKTACETATSSGILVVAAAGNDGTSVNNYPAAYDCVVGVASLDEDGTTSYFSQFGDSVYVAAPGARVTSLSIDGPSEYATGSGTSYACPEVVSLAALARSVFPEMSQNDFKTMLQETSIDKGTEGFDKYYGWGLVDFKAASDYLLERAYVPVYHTSFSITDQDGAALNDVTIQVQAAEDIEWEDDEEAGIKAGSWAKGTVIPAQEDGTFSLHKGRYSYTLEKEGYYSKGGSFTTYSEYQNIYVTLEKTYQVALDVIDSEGDKIDNAQVSLTRTTDSLSETLKQSDTGNYAALIPEGKYKYNIEASGYEEAAGYIEVKRSDLNEKLILHTSGEVSHVKVECRKAADEGETGDIIEDVSLVLSDVSGKIIPALDDGTYQLERGKKYSYTAVRAGYEDEAGKFKVTNEADMLVTISMNPSAYYAVFKAVDADGQVLKDAEFDITDANGEAVEPVKTNRAKYNLAIGTYNYTVNCGNYGATQGSFTMKRQDQYREFNIVLEAVTHSVQLNIQDADGINLADAQVTIYDAANNLQVSNKDNTWNLAAGTYNYNAYCEGYELGLGTLSVSDQDIAQTITLKKNSDPSGVFAGGDGSKENPYLVSNEAQLRAIAADKAYYKDSFRLLCDIALTQGDWEPIGYYNSSDDAQYFTGTFDGAGHVITGLSINRLNDSYNGFFGAVKSAHIKNLRVNGEVKAGKYTGGIVGYVEYANLSDNDTSTVISNCQFAGPVRGSDYVGGIVGYVNAEKNARMNVLIAGCAHTDGLIRAYSSSGTYGMRIGGIAGEVRATVIRSCYNLGDITAADYLGGIVGSLEANASLYNSYSTGYISQVGSSTSGCKGGLVGSLSGNAQDSYYLKQDGVTAGIGLTKDGSSSSSIASKTTSTMNANKSFVDALNLLDDTMSNTFTLTDSYPALYWQVEKEAKVSAQKPEISQQPQSANYYVHDSDVKALSTKVNAVQDGGTLTYQWYCNEVAALDGAEKISGACGSVPSDGVVECLPNTDEVGDAYYYVVIINTFKGTVNNVTYRSGTSSDFAKITIKSKTVVAAPTVKKIGVEKADGTKLDNPLEATYFKGEASNDVINVEASAEDGGTLTYQWYISDYPDTKGSPIKGAIDKSCAIDTANEGTSYYYVAITNTKDLEGGATDSIKIKTQRVKIIVLDKDVVSSSAVIDLIGKIGQVSLESENAISEARAAYDALSDNAKSRVENYDVLVAAEKALDDLKRKEATPHTQRNVVTSLYSYNAVKLSWNTDSKALGYEIYRYNSGTSWKLVKTITGANVSTWIDTSLKTGTSYSYRVRAFNEISLHDNVEKLYGDFSAVKSAKPVLSKTAITLKAGKKKATISWKKVAGASGYKIYRSTKKGSGYKCVKTVTKASTSKYVNKKLKGGKRYYYKIRAYRTVNGKKVYSSYSTVKSVKTKK